jgi:hypothetical protein
LCAQQYLYSQRECFSMKFFLIITFSFTTFLGSAQVGNEWIQYNQQYFKIPVAKDGFYKLTAANLQAAGVSGSVDPRTFQLFHRGTEHAIHVEGQSDGQLNASDYIEFYGQRNDGTQDTKLYKNPGAQPHTFHNLYSDTTSYFLTYGGGSGKRISLSSQSSSGLTAETFHWNEKKLVLAEDYSGGLDYGDIQNSDFEEGEGWMSAQIVQTQTKSFTLENLTLGVTAGGVPELEIVLTGRGRMQHVVELYAGARFLNTIQFSGYTSFKHSGSLQWTDIGGDGKITIHVKPIGVGEAPDRVSVGYIRIRYPQQTDMVSTPEKIFSLAENAADKSYLEIKNPAAGTRIYDITDPANLIQIATSQTTTLNAVVSGTSTVRKLFSTASPVTPAVKKISFRQINPAAHDFIIITHPLLRKPALGYTDPVKAFAEYRALPQGGSHDTLVVNIQQLYDQFNFGEQSPLAVFHFLKFLNAVKTPKYLFLIGKGLEVNLNYYRNPSAFTDNKDLVPTAGFPASDMRYSAFDGTRPMIATGRLAANGPQDVVNYFNKVKEMEALPFDDLRRKNILHLSGGIYEGEPQTFRSYLEEFAVIAKDYQFGGQVKAIAKQSTDIEVINVADEVNRGLNLITFFGHAAAEATDFDIGFVDDPVMGYNNKGKYPVILMNGCSAGSFFLNLDKPIFGENWINTPNLGAIGVIAHSSFGFAFSLHQYSTLFYEIGYRDPAFSGSGLGDIQKEIASRYLATAGISPVSTTQVQQMILLGDPSVKLFGATKSDYAIKPNTLLIESINGEPVTALSDSFKLSFVVNNFGKAIDQDFTVEITRTLNDNSEIVYDSIFPGVLYSNTLNFVLPGKIENGSGNNTFTVRIDPLQAVDELREDNNTGSIGFFIPLSGTKNLYPQDFAIVSQSQLQLTLQHTDQLGGEREFVVELDTIPDFSSGFKKQFVVKGTVLASQAISLPQSDTLAYYWRSKLASPAANESQEWDVSSFTYIVGGTSGWAQVHFPQYDKNPSVGLVKDPVLREIRFEETVTDIAVKTFGAAASKPADSVSVKINGAEYNIISDGGGTFSCRNNTLNLIAFDKKTTQPYAGVRLGWVCGREPYVINSFLTAELSVGNGIDLIQYINNIAAGDSVVLFTIGDVSYGLWPQEVKDKLGELGISNDQINALQQGEPLVIFARKGSTPGTARVFKSDIAPANQQEVAVEATITGRFTSGTMSSPLIGPVKKWNRLDVRYKESDNSDETFIDIIGVRLNGEEELVKTDLQAGTDISSIDAELYPSVRIVFKAADPTLVTPAQLYHWVVTYQPVAEGMLLYDGNHEQESLFEGQIWQGEYSFVNISNEVFEDSLQVNYAIRNPQTFATTLAQLRIQAPAPGDTTHFTVPVSTFAQDGVNDVQVFVNPRVVSEVDYDNNVISLLEHLNVLFDRKAPVLDVTVDGRHVVRDEFISPNPEITIMLWDNNPHLLKKDTTGVTLLLAYPCASDECDFQRIYFSSSEISWKAETDTSEFSMIFKPDRLPEGKYTLRAEASDANGNFSGTQPFEIHVQVKTETTLVLHPAYPNPFADKTHFEFTLTGNELPSSFGLEILTLSGKSVHRFSEADVNHFFIGRNILTWEAMDQQGNPLPNGIYIYRIAIKAGDQMITRLGKIVLVR